MLVSSNAGEDLATPLQMSRSGCRRRKNPIFSWTSMRYMLENTEEATPREEEGGGDAREGERRGDAGEGEHGDAGAGERELRERGRMCSVPELEGTERVGSVPRTRSCVRLRSRNGIN
jgi:hypothetical protein